MANTHFIGFGIIKVEEAPSPGPFVAALPPTPSNDSVPIPFDPKDPEGFLRRCAGSNKKTKLRCNSVIGQKAQQNCHPTFLPTCRAHRDQQSFAGWCQYQTSTGERCGRLFRWTPPYFELCSEHQGHPDTPCYFFTLPLELRHEIYRYLLPDRPIGSSTASLHDGQEDSFEQRVASSNAFPAGPFQSSSNGVGRFSLTRCGPLYQSVFSVSALDLFLVSRKVYQEVKDLLFSTVPFKIDVRKDGTFMCGRRLLEPRRADGSSHFLPDESDEAKQRFLKYFDWSAVKHYAVDVLIENWSDQAGVLYPHSSWDEEVEMYDMRDYISVVVSGVLAKSRNLCKLQVRLCLADFDWPHEKILQNTKVILGPFERLRNVRQPQLLGVFKGRPHYNSVMTVQRPPKSTGNMAPICSVASIPTHTPLMYPGIPDFDEYAANWARWISSSSGSSITSKPPIRNMFTEFKEFYSKLAIVVADISRRNGRHAFLHRARVAREQEDVESFRNIRNELIHYWNLYLDQEERKKADMNARLGRMLDTDIYPSHEWEQSSSDTRRSSTSADVTLQSPVLLNSETMAREGIPMTANPPKQVLSSNPGMFNANNGGHTTLLEDFDQRNLMILTRQNQIQKQLRLQQQVQQQMQQQTQQQRMMLMNQMLSQSAGPRVPPLCTNGNDTQDEQTTTTNMPSFSHLGLSGSFVPQTEAEARCFSYIPSESDWSNTTGEPGPSMKRRRIDSAYGEMNSSSSETTTPIDNEGAEFEQPYTGKGKGKVGVEVICLE